MITKVALDRLSRSLHSDVCDSDGLRDAAIHSTISGSGGRRDCAASNNHQTIDGNHWTKLLNNSSEICTVARSQMRIALRKYDVRTCIWYERW